jgi:hypothetical protein
MSKKWDIQLPLNYKVTDDHYIIDGIKYHRVTRIKSVMNNDGLNKWRSKIGDIEADKIMVERQQIGTDTHKMIELTLDKSYVDLDLYGDEVKQNMFLINELRDKCCLEPESLEQKLWSTQHRIAGTADYIGSYKTYPRYLKRKRIPKFSHNAMVIIDWKTSTQIYDDYWIQLSAYVYMFEELTGIRVDGAVIVQFRNNKVKVEEKTYDELKQYFSLMLNCLELYRYKKGEKK